jgi:GAF domain-containing protein
LNALQPGAAADEPPSQPTVEADADATQLLSSATDLAAIGERRGILRELLRCAVELLDAEDAGVSLWDEQRGQLLAVDSHELPSFAGTVMDLDQSASGQAARTRRPVVINDYQATPGRTSPAGRGGAQAVVAVPLVHRVRLLGCLSVTSRRPGRRFSERDALRLQPLATLAAAVLVGMERARLEGVHLAVRTVEHELNNSLAVTGGYAELLLRDERLPEVLREHAAEALRGVREAARLVARLTALTQLREVEWGDVLTTTLDLAEDNRGVEPAGPAQP